jgi:trigger factor
MTVSVETLGGLERKLIISVPSEKLESEIESRLKNLAHKVKIDGFRPGKVPFSVVKKRYSDSVRHEVVRDQIQETLYEALSEKKLVPADTPNIEAEEIAEGKDFVYSARFEVFPEFEVVELDNEEVEIITSEVSDADIDTMIENLREQNMTWTEVERKTQLKDKVTINFEGFLDGVAFDGGKAENQELVLGSKTMIPGFEDGIVGHTIGEDFEINTKFPEGYASTELAGKDAVFKIKITKIQEGQLPELNDEFVKNFNITSGGVDALKLEIKQSMVRELDRRVSSINREKIFDKVLLKNDFEIPASLVEKEIGHLKHQMYHKLFGHEHSDNETIPDFPRELFEAQAVNRVKLSLLFSEYVKKHEIKVDSVRVDAMIDKLASAYDNPDSVREFYRNNSQKLEDIEGFVMEEMVADQMVSCATIVPKLLGYQEVMNHNQTEEV